MRKMRVLRVLLVLLCLEEQDSCHGRRDEEQDSCQKKIRSGLSQVYPGSPGSGSTCWVDRVSPGQIPGYFLLRPGSSPGPGRPGPRLTAGPGRASKLWLFMNRSHLTN